MKAMKCERFHGAFSCKSHESDDGNESYEGYESAEEDDEAEAMISF